MTARLYAENARPTLRLLSLGAGVQSTAVLLLACDRAIPPFDIAYFADTGWESKAVYANLARLTEHAAKAGIPVRSVSAGNLRRDALDPAHRFVSIPLHTRNPDGSKGLARRQCTNEYKIVPLKRAARHALGYPHPARVPKGVYAEQAIGISVDEIHRAKDADVAYLRNVFPLLDLGWTRADCERFLTERGWTGIVKSACLGCPFHSNTDWKWVRDNDPDGWADAVEFDRQIRHGYPHATAKGQHPRRTYYLHSTCRPLGEVDLDRPTHRVRVGVGDSVGAAGGGPTGDPDGCSPWACRSGDPADTTPDAAPNDRSGSGAGVAA
jgi:3'-phosphoadenosine 5'-phosphosulfate sulfotransferase (PAPS reductase)/FAD synthetase